MKVIKKLILMGANNPQTIRLIEDINTHSTDKIYEILGWIDNDLEKSGREFFGHKVLGTPEVLQQSIYTDCFLVNNITTNAKVRYETIQQLKGYNMAFETLVHPSVNSSMVEIGEGCIVHENVILEAGVGIGDFAVISSGSIVCHESNIGEYTFISSGVKIAGLVDVKEQVSIYLGALITPRLILGKGSSVSAGSVVFENLEIDSTVAGNPARVIDKVHHESVSNIDNVEQRIKTLFSKEFPTLLTINKNDYFADYDLLPSFEMLRLITFLEEEFTIKILDHEVDEENLGSFENIIVFINKKKLS